MKTTFLTACLGLFLVIFSGGFIGCKKPGSAAHYQKGVELFQDGDIQGAQKEYELGLAKDPKNVELLYAQGWAYLSQGNQQQALVSFGRCLKFDDKYYGGYKGMGSIYAALGNTEKAEEYFRKAIELAPKNASNYGNLGDLYLAAGRVDEARATYEKGAALMGEYADVQNGLINVLIHEQKYDAAITLGEATLQKPFKQKSLKGQTYELLASAYVERAKASMNLEDRKKDLDQARSTLEKAQESVKDPRPFAPLRTEIELLTNEHAEKSKPAKAGKPK